MAALDQCVCFCFNNGIAVIAAIVYGITFFYNDRNQTITIFERRISNTCYAVRDINGSKIPATIECQFSNTRNAVWDSDGSQISTIGERLFSYARYAVRDSNRFQTIATIEGILSNARYTARDGNGCQTRATIECQFSNTRNRSVEGDYTLTIFVCVANDIGTEDVGCVWCNGTIIGGCVEYLPCRVVLFYELTDILCPIGCLVCCSCSARNGAYRIRTEQTSTNCRRRNCLYSDRFQTIAIIEGSISNARHAVRYRDRSERGARLERTHFNTR